MLWMDGGVTPVAILTVASVWARSTAGIASAAPVAMRVRKRRRNMRGLLFLRIQLARWRRQGYASTMPCQVDYAMRGHGKVAWRPSKEVVFGIQEVPK